MAFAGAVRKSSALFKNLAGGLPNPPTRLPNRTCIICCKVTRQNPVLNIWGLQSLSCDALTIAKVNGRTRGAGNAGAARRAGGGAAFTLKVREIVAAPVSLPIVRRSGIVRWPSTVNRCLVGN